MDKENKVKVSAYSTLDRELPEVAISFEDCGTRYIFRGVYAGNRAISSKLLWLIENDGNDAKGADK